MGDIHPHEYSMKNEKRKGWYRRLFDGLLKTREEFIGKLETVLSDHSRFDEKDLEELEEILYTSDLGPVVIETVFDKLRLGEKGKENSIERVRSILIDLLRSPAKRPSIISVNPTAGEPRVIILIGVNGVGKTTTTGKLAARFAADGKKVMIAAADTFRAGAGDQIEIWANRVGCELIRNKEGADPSAVMFDAVQAAKARKLDVILADTAGRLHTKTNLMEELKKICRVTAKQLPGAPHEVYLVLDATSGQNVLAQVREFGESLGVTGLILTKLDGSSRGGVIIGAAHESGVPIRFVGVGEKVEDLIDFDPDQFIFALFGKENPDAAGGEGPGSPS